MSQSALYRLAERLERLERQQAAAQTPQLGHSSIEDGAIDVHNGDGQLRAIVGTLPDATIGVLAVNGAAPPQPSPPICDSSPRGYVASWDGHNADGTDIQPLDWSRIEIHSSVAFGFQPTSNTLRATIESPQGGSVSLIAGPEYVPGLTDEYEVLLIARNTSGTASAESDRVRVRVGQVEATDVADFALTVTKMQSLRHQLY